MTESQDFLILDTLQQIPIGKTYYVSDPSHCLVSFDETADLKYSKNYKIESPVSNLIGP